MTYLMALRLEAEPAALLELTPRLGRVMVVGQSGPITHERIGTVEEAEREGSRFRLSGATQESEADLDALSHVVFDASSEMQGKVYPRLEFRDSEDVVVFSIIGMEGLEPFSMALEGIPAAPAAPAEEQARPEARELGESDPALPVFRAVEGVGREVSIGFTKLGFSQNWRGEIAALRPSSGFLNVMTKDFHLHLRGGGVAAWETDEAGANQALDSEGRRIGLSLKAEA